MQDKVRLAFIPFLTALIQLSDEDIEAHAAEENSEADHHDDDTNGEQKVPVNIL